MKAISILVPLISAVYVSAHGLLTNFVVDGQNGRNAIRKASSQDPNYGTDNPAITCGPNAKPAGTTVDAKPGSNLSFEWRTAGNTNWPHNTGPMITYLASCGGSCTSFNAAGAQWFKIDQVGRKPGSGNWFQEDLMSGAAVSVKLPSNLASGEYLVRHEIIALHLATSFRMAEFYPGCAQIKVSGSGTGKPAAGELVTFPGGYKDSDPGIFDKNVFNSGVAYPFPGPAISALAGTGGAPPAGNNTGSGSGGSTKSGTTTSSSAPPAKTGSSKSCNLKKKKRDAVASPDSAYTNETSIFKPRHISRVMRRLAFDESH